MSSAAKATVLLCNTIALSSSKSFQAQDLAHTPKVLSSSKQNTRSRPACTRITGERGLVRYGIKLNTSKMHDTAVNDICSAPPEPLDSCTACTARRAQHTIVSREQMYYEQMYYMQGAMCCATNAHDACHPHKISIHATAPKTPP